MNTVLLTATISPPLHVKNLTRTDVGLRLRDYQAALDFYLQRLEDRTIDRLIFCDNSAFDLTTLRERAQVYVERGQAEFLSFQGIDYAPERGRGYGEFKLVDYAMNRSNLMTLHGEATTVWKITGRYIVSNLRRLIATRPTNCDLYVNLRNVPRRWMDLYLLGWNRRAYEGLIRGVCDRIDETGSLLSSEEFFRRYIDATDQTVQVKKRFVVTPQLAGHRGFDNQAYGSMNARRVVRATVNTLAPWLWV